VNLLEILTKNDALVSQMAQGLGVGSQDARSGMEALLPALTRGLQRNTQNQGGLGGLANAIQNGGHQRYIERPDLLGQRESIQDGNNILGHILGSKDVSRNVAAHASKETGLDSDILKKMLPMLAAAVMGGLGQQSQAGGGAGGGLLGQMLGAATGGGSRASSGSPGTAMLEQLLDSNQDGNVLDDVLSLAKKFL
jgi:hypothetical protein